MQEYLKTDKKQPNQNNDDNCFSFALPKYIIDDPKPILVKFLINPILEVDNATIPKCSGNNNFARITFVTTAKTYDNVGQT